MPRQGEGWSGSLCLISKSSSLSLSKHLPLILLGTAWNPEGPEQKEQNSLPNVPNVPNVPS
jgi:hypothetical protein